jgi:predicted MFS family arabinose efflux permease
MRHSPRRQWSYASFLLLLAVDLVVLSFLLFSQWLAWPSAALWGLSLVATLALWPVLLSVSDRVFAMARKSANIPWTGESFP